MLLLKFILAHMIGDFFLQTSSMVEHKNRKKWASPQLYIHGLIHFILILVIAGFENWLAATIITISHIAIDGMKVNFQNERNARKLFFIDQAAHLLVLVVVWYIISPAPPYSFLVINSYTIAVAIAYLFLTRPTAIIIAQALNHWTTEIIQDGETEKSLPKAGWYIGVLERILVLTFILIGQWGAIGFLMAAKSIFRFGDLTRAKDRKLTEYILIGTFLSFGIAILTGILITQFLNY